MGVNVIKLQYLAGLQSRVIMWLLNLRPQSKEADDHWSYQSLAWLLRDLWPAGCVSRSKARPTCDHQRGFVDSEGLHEKWGVDSEIDLRMILPRKGTTLTGTDREIHLRKGRTTEELDHCFVSTGQRSRSFDYLLPTHVSCCQAACKHSNRHICSRLYDRTYTN